MGHCTEANINEMAQHINVDELYKQFFLEKNELQRIYIISSTSLKFQNIQNNSTVSL